MRGNGNVAPNWHGRSLAASSFSNEQRHLPPLTGKENILELRGFTCVESQLRGWENLKMQWGDAEMRLRPESVETWKWRRTLETVGERERVGGICYSVDSQVLVDVGLVQSVSRSRQVTSWRRRRTATAGSTSLLAHEKKWKIADSVRVSPSAGQMFANLSRMIHLMRIHRLKT